jgi:hypothetical protein
MSNQQGFILEAYCANAHSRLTGIGSNAQVGEDCLFAPKICLKEI